jgi:hypothetical protein
VKLTTTILMMLSALLCALAWVFQDQDDHDHLFGASMLLAAVCVLWGLLGFRFAPRKTLCLVLAIACLLAGVVELYFLFLICARTMA